MVLARKNRFGCAAVFAFAAVTALNESIARSTEVAARLDYKAAAGCPSAHDLEAVVAERLGHDPFRKDAPQGVVARIELSGRTLDGRLEWRDATGARVGERTFPSRSGDCGELVRAMGFALALQFQLLAANPAGAQQPATPPAVSQTPTAITTVPPVPSRAPSTPVVDSQRGLPNVGSRSGPSLMAGAGASAAVGLSPSPVALGRLFGAVAWSRIAVELSAEISFPSTTRRTDGTGFSERVLLAGLAGCGLHPPLSACLVAKVGQIRVSGLGVDSPAVASGLLVQTGLRLAVTQTLGSRAHIALHAEGLVLPTRATVTLDSMAVWTAPRGVAAVGLDLGVRFP